MYWPGQLEADALRLDIFFRNDLRPRTEFPVASGSASLVPTPISTAETVQAVGCRPDQAVPGVYGRSRFPPVTMRSDSSPDHPMNRSCQIGGSSATPVPIPDALIRLDMIQCATSDACDCEENWTLIQERVGSGRASPLSPGSGPVRRAHPHGAARAPRCLPAVGRGAGAGCAC